MRKIIASVSVDPLSNVKDWRTYSGIGGGGKPT